MSPEALFRSQLPLIERLIASICRRHGCREEEAEEFASWARLKLLEDDYAVLRKFEGKSKLSTYLTVVLERLFLDFRVQRWGKWRPSAAARRGGTVAVQLESLLYRDGYGLDEAIRILRGNFGVEAGREELEEVAATLPARGPRRFEDAERLETVGVDGGVEEPLRDAERAEAAEKTQAALGQALATLDAEDRLVLKMRFEDGFTVARIARVLGENQRQLYTRVEKALRSLREAMEEAGVGAGEVAEVLGWDAGAMEVDYRVDEGRESGGTRPSN